jgi:hypothetical protein
MSKSTEPQLAISLPQPWAWLIIHGGKDIENRTWTTKFRGRIWIHGAATATDSQHQEVFRLTREIHEGLRIPAPEDLHLGGSIGSVEIIDCVERHPSPWFFGPKGFVLQNPEPCEFRPCRGALGLFKPQF